MTLGGDYKKGDGGKMSGLVHGLVSGTSHSHGRTDGFESALKRVKYLVAVAALHGWGQQMWQRSLHCRSCIQDAQHTAFTSSSTREDGALGLKKQELFCLHPSEVRAAVGSSRLSLSTPFSLEHLYFP